MQGGGTQGCKVEEPRGARWRDPGVQGGGTQGCKVEANGSIMKQPVKHSGEEGGATPGRKVEANGSIMKQPVKHSGATFVKLYASWRVVRH